MSTSASSSGIEVVPGFTSNRIIPLERDAPFASAIVRKSDCGCGELQEPA
jgi:hypothetical protein